MTQTFTGQCLCGAVQFEYDAPSLWSAHCHCSQCRRAHGAAFVTWVGAPESRFRVVREHTLSWYQSSKIGRRGFCSACGSTVLFHSSRWPGEMHISRANIDGEIDIKPLVHVYYGSEPVSWFTFKDNLKHEHGDG